jgi:L-2,4-diaminobutyric acid acetyltransferase
MLQQPVKDYIHPKLAEFIEAGGEISSLNLENSMPANIFLNDNVPLPNRYADYYTAAVAEDSPDSGIVITNGTIVTGAAVGLIREDDLVLSHLRSVTQDPALEAGILSELYRRASSTYGIKTILDTSNIIGSSVVKFLDSSIITPKRPILTNPSSDDHKYLSPRDKSPITLRRPQPEDVTGVMEVVRRVNEYKQNNPDANGLDIYPPISYSRMLEDFRDTSIVAEHNGKIAGFVTGRPSGRMDSNLFVWQVGVDPDQQKQRIGFEMLHSLAERTMCEGVITTIEPGNEASEGLFNAFSAAFYSSNIQQIGVIPAKALGDGHACEIVYRMQQAPI